MATTEPAAGMSATEVSSTSTAEMTSTATSVTSPAAAVASATTAVATTAAATAASQCDVRHAHHSRRDQRYSRCENALAHDSFPPSWIFIRI